MDICEKESRLAAILQKRAHIDFKKSHHLRDEKLLGEKIGMPARELVLVLYDIEREFDIQIPEQAIIGGRFDTYNHIAGIVNGPPVMENTKEGEILTRQEIDQ